MRILRIGFVLFDSMLFSCMIAYAIRLLIRISDHSFVFVILFPPILVLVCLIRMIAMKHTESEHRKSDEERRRTESLINKR